jgi:hypothetical protein
MGQVDAHSSNLPSCVCQKFGLHRAMARFLSSPKDVIHALGGVHRVAELTGRKYKAAWNWTTFKTFPTDTYLVLTRALAKQGRKASPSLWGMTEPAE